MEAPADSRPTRRFCRAVSRSPLAGIAPWLPVSILTAAELTTTAAVLSLIISAVFFSMARWSRDSVKSMEVFDLAWFALFAIACLSLTGQPGDWINRWGGELSTAVVFVFTATTLATRRPFASEYTRESVAPELWNGELFRHVNLVITWTWLVCFGAQLASTVFAEGVLHNPDDLVFGWIIPAASLVVGLVVTYRATNRLVRSSDRPTVADGATLPD